jgi:hypothetical protein
VDPLNSIRCRWTLRRLNFSSGKAVQVICDLDRSQGIPRTLRQVLEETGGGLEVHGFGCPVATGRKDR